MLNNLDDDILEVYVAKYIDDMTLIDVVPNTVKTEIDVTGNKPLHTIYPDKSQEAFKSIANKATAKN